MEGECSMGAAMNIPVQDLKDMLAASMSGTKTINQPAPEALRLLEMLDNTSTDSRPEICIGFVPGRIEIFGRHTDYAGGRSLVCAIQRGFNFASARSRDRVVRLTEDSTEFLSVEFPLRADLAPVPGDWANYPKTMARRFARNFGAEGFRGANIVFSSTLPVGSGMSGSSALVMMVFTALAAANRLGDSPVFRRTIRTPLDLSVYLACAENGQGFRGLEGDNGVGTFGGSEDHAAILTCRRGSASLFGFDPIVLQGEIAWPTDWQLVVAFSGVRAEKTREALEKYNLVSLRARAAVQRYNAVFHTGCTSLNEVADHVAEVGSEPALDALDRDGEGPPGLAQRVRQFIKEDRIFIPKAVEALRKRDLEPFGEVLSGSHHMSAEWLWNIVPEIDFLQHSALKEGAAGASGFGAGFGGSIVAVVRSDRAGAFLEAWRDGYARRYPEQAQGAVFFPAGPEDGIRVWSKSGPALLADILFQT
jgi:galactokinase